jgi:hypothetical protein
MGPPHDPDDVLGQLAPSEPGDEVVLDIAAASAGLTTEQMRAAMVAAEEHGVSSRIAWRERIRRKAPPPIGETR